MPRIEVRGVKLNVTEMAQRGRRRRAGDATPIVMIHGLAASQAFWYAAGAQFLTLLGPCLLYDLRGHGKSGTSESGYGVGDMAGDLAELMDLRAMPRAHIIAHSFGGMIALAFALRHPERVASLTLVDVRVRPIQRKLSIPLNKAPPAVERRLAQIGIDLSKVSQHDDGVGYLKTVARIEVEAGEDAAELLATIYRHPRLFRTRRNAERWIQLTERVSLIADLDREPFTAADLTRLEMPMLILVGGRSTTLASAQKLKRLCPHAYLREVPEVGHFFPMSQPRLFLQPTLRFIRRVNQGLARTRRPGAEGPRAAKG